MSEEILHKKIQESFQNLFVDVPDIPKYILDNLNHELRDYQKQALRQFMFTQELSHADLSYNYLLFHMATGSGKTLVLASSILYLYKEHGYQNFLFFADSDAIVKKTHDNLTNVHSPKYLFHPNGIVIDGNLVSVQIVDMFPAAPARHTIYLKLTSIQKLHGDLTEPKENGMTFEQLKDYKIVLLGDEAHHYFAETKKNQKRVSKKELEKRSWERTLEQLLNLNPKNRMLGFSATFNLRNEFLYHKIKDKIVYQYDLKKFMEDKFSKNVVLLRANEDDETKMLHGILLSQYRKYIALDHAIDLKPVIMFKSSTIKVSEQAYANLLRMIEHLTVEQLQKIINHGLMAYQNENSIWNQMFSYYNEKKDLEEVVSDLKWDFTEQTVLNVHSQVFLSEENALLLNSLEERENPIRAIFQIAKLNEGWDVLNLYDIVRISEGASTTLAMTDSEAQLIGRGARYYPFEYEGERSHTRRFDHVPSELKILETLHYHTINESAYIKNLEKSLDKENIQVLEDVYERFEAKVKTEFKQTDIYQQGKIYVNKRVPTTVEDYDHIAKYQISTVYEIPLSESIEQKYGAKKQIVSAVEKHEVEWKVEKRFIQKAIQRNPFYRFHNLKKYVPAISSMKDFIEHANFLGDLKLLITLPSDVSLADLAAADKLGMVEKFLKYAENQIRLNYKKERGTPYFEGIAMKEMIGDYFIEVSRIQSASQEQIFARSMHGHDWYVYDKAIVNRLENDMIDFVHSYVEELKKKYADVYLIRNERKIKVVEIDGVRGFMPDFLLYLKDENCTYQVFLEPKGDHLSKEDEWKQDFLMELSENPKIEILDENEHVRLLGIKFYSNDPDKKRAFREDFIEKLL